MTNQIRLGWEEWIALPDLGLPALKAKVDTGARTSALHAFDIEPFGPASQPHVRFAIHPVPGRAFSVACSAPILDRREVTSSNGETELRYVIETRLSVGNRDWPIEVTLTDRGSMAYRMLLGRQAFGSQVVVVPGESFCQPKLDYSAYARTYAEAPPRSLRVAILGRDTEQTFIASLVAEGERRGHGVDILDARRCYMALNALAPEIYYDGKRLPRFDAVVPRIAGRDTAYGCAVLRQFETIGTWCLNGPAAIAAACDRLHAQQLLARARIPTPATAFADSPKDTGNLIGLVGTAPLIVKLLDPARGRGVVYAKTRDAAESVIGAFRGLRANFLVQDFVEEAGWTDIRCIVVHGNVVAAMQRNGSSGDAKGATLRPIRPKRAERALALRAAKIFRLGLVEVVMLRTAEGPKVLSVDPTPRLDRFAEAAAGPEGAPAGLAQAVFDRIETRMQPSLSRRKRGSRE
ncbi:S6 modification enzyme RimK [Oceaniovalibus guishaninsula JLT2003]|uniref:S6 modification enzyme RimK n=1 Tax=Oceaniovalibus guishaninsula JLT2003 TaxID=1231392 RepID=K2HA95_9RHOB|nr:RimK family alpha-L-glutamate ligase [Oceaniovalibus guishaninsula]EKE43557.1 S6 modification enzyme RimK [Oceaniovalibus guishaninsula JLT2003]